MLDRLDHKNPASFERWMVIIGATIALLSLIVIYLQLRVMGGQLSEMRSSSVDTRSLADAAQSQAKSANKAAQAAEIGAFASKQIAENAAKNLMVARRAMQLDERAWMGMNPPSGPIVAGKTMSISLVVTNVGKTPAYNVTLRARMEPRRAGEQPDLNYQIPPVDSRAVAVPRGGFRTTIMPPVGTPTTQEQLQSLRAGAWTVFVWGKITYDDVFGGKHWSRFCYFVDRDAESYNLCQTGNDLDRPGRSP